MSDANKKTRVTKVNNFFQEKAYPNIMRISGFPDNIYHHFSPPDLSVLIMPVAIGLLIAEASAKVITGCLLVIAALLHGLSLAIAKIADICAKPDDESLTTSTTAAMHN